MPSTVEHNPHDSKILAAKHINAIDTRLRKAVKIKSEAFERKLEAVSGIMLDKACDTLRAVSRSGPMLAEHLKSKAESPEMSMDEIESGSRVYERLMNTSRKTLGMDKDESSGKSTFNIGVAYIGPSPSEAFASSPSSPVVGPVELPVIDVLPDVPAVDLGAGI